MSTADIKTHHYDDTQIITCTCTGVHTLHVSNFSSQTLLSVSLECSAETEPLAIVPVECHGMPVVSVLYHFLAHIHTLCCLSSQGTIKQAWVYKSFSNCEFACVTNYTCRVCVCACTTDAHKPHA